jgi:hypothetical protein
MPENTFGEVEASVGSLEFVDEFSDPTVTLSHERETADHKVVTGHTAYRDNNVEYVVQALGQRPSEITIEGWVTQDQLDIVDEIVGEQTVDVVTARWTGIAVPKSASTTYPRTYHEIHGWMFEVDMSLLAVQRGQLGEPTKAEINSSTTSEEDNDGVELGTLFSGSAFGDDR